METVLQSGAKGSGAGVELNRDRTSRVERLEAQIVSKRKW